MLNSHYDYVKGSATQEYKNTVNSIAEKAQRQITKYPEKLQEVQTLLDRYSKQLADWHNKQLSIRCMCPSVLVCGAGNFPTRKKAKQNAAEDRHFKEYEKIEQLANRIASASVSNVIKSGDTNALEQLQSKLTGLQNKREAIKAHNTKARKEKTEQVPAYVLSNLGQNIRTIEQRIEQLQKTKEQPTEDKSQQYKTSMCKVVENTEIMRLQLLFDGKPDDNIRGILKSHGFKWSPTNTAWQRQLTDNARYATQRVIKLIEEQNTVNQAS